MEASEQDDIGTGIEALERAIKKLERESSDDNRTNVHAEARALAATFVDESVYAVEVDRRHDRVKTLFTRASDLMSANPDDLSAQVTGYTEEMTNFSAAKIQQLLASV